METNELLHIQSLINDLSKKIDSLMKDKNVAPEPMSSELTNELAEAFAKAQGEIPIAHANKTNPYLMTPYTDLKELIETSRPALTKYGLSVKQPIIEDQHNMLFLYTVLQHSSGQWVQSKIRLLPTKNDIQTIESYIAMMKRMAYGSLLCLAVQSEDDDGERAVADERYGDKKGTAINMKYDPREEITETITKEQIEELEYELSEYPEMANDLLTKLKISRIYQIPKSKYRAVMTQVRSIKNSRNNSK